MDRSDANIIIDIADPLPVTDEELALIEMHFAALIAAITVHEPSGVEAAIA